MLHVAPPGSNASELAGLCDDTVSIHEAVLQLQAIISVLPRSSAYNLAIIARGASKLSSVLHVPRELWETLDAVAASKASEFSDLVS